MIGKIRRLLNLHESLAAAEDRITSLEAQVKTLQKQYTNLREQQSRTEERQSHFGERLGEQQAELRRQVLPLQNRFDRFEGRIGSRTDHIAEQIDYLKSNLEVPQELVEEFFEWKARTPIPERPLVTVIVATYNRARLLTERCIPSVLGQTYPDLELVVVGDNCTDETEEAVTGIQDPRLEFINLPTRGVYPEDPIRRWMVAGTVAMNEGLSMANGDFVTHLDDDDEYVPERLERLVRFATENGCDFTWHPYWWENNEGKWRLNEATNFAYSDITTSSVFYRSWFRKIPWDIDSHRLMEPGDWNRFRKIKYINPVSMRYPEPLLKHYRQNFRS